MSRWKIVWLSVAILGCSEHKCLTGASADFDLSDDTAIRITKETLEAEGHDTSHMKAVPYGDDGKIFARNSQDRNNGYVLWHKEGEKTLYEYSVSIERRNGDFVCKLGKTL